MQARAESTTTGEHSSGDCYDPGMSRFITTALSLVALVLLLTALPGCPKGSSGGGGNLTTCLGDCRTQLQERLRDLTSKGQVPGMAEEKLEEECKAGCREKYGE